jgi:N-acetylglucosamine-6-phosphate deacetylase
VGVTAFCPTLITRTRPAYTAAADALRAARWPAAGARPLGVHLEGPFLNRERRGAHPWRGLADPTPDRLAALVDVFAPRIVTLAPELDGGLDAVAALARAGIVAAVGHTEAGAGLCTKAIAAGARLLTHALNAMPPVKAREPGPLGAFLADRRCHVAVIADGVHLAPATLAILERAAGRQLLVVSDAVAAAGAPAGPSTLSGRRVISDGSRVRDARGRLAGSARPISDGPAALRALGRPAAQALAAAATAPRALLGATDPFAAGQPADLVVVDETLRPRVTFIAGRMVWNDTDLAIPS